MPPIDGLKGYNLSIYAAAILAPIVSDLGKTTTNKVNLDAGGGVHIKYGQMSNENEKSSQQISKFDDKVSHEAGKVLDVKSFGKYHSAANDKVH